MNQKTKLKSTEKRASLKRLRNVGIGSAVVASMGTSEWMRPIVKQVMLPAHAATTEAPRECSPPIVTAEKLACSSGQPIEITIRAVPGSPVRILSIPTIVATPPTFPNANGDWKTVTGGATPALITDTEPYFAVTRGQVMDEVNSGCTPPANSVPATGVPNDPGVPLTSLELTFSYVCDGDNVDTTVQTVEIDILTLV